MSDRNDDPVERIEAAAFQPLAADSAAPKRRLRPVAIVAAAGAVLFLLALAFLLTARSVEIDVVAEAPVAIAIDGFALPFGQRFLIRPGRYPITIGAEGYEPHRSTLTVGSADTQRYEVTLKPLPGQVTFTGLPAGATLTLDGEALRGAEHSDNPDRRGDAAPARALAFEIAAGEHTLRAEAPRYLPLESTIDVTGRGVTQTIALELAPAWAELTVASEPEGATIAVGDEVLGKTPATVAVLQGDRELRLRAPGFAEYRATLAVIAREPQDLGTVTLVPAAGVLELTSRPGGANVTVGGEFRGQTPLTVELTPDRAHELVLSRPGYRRYRDSVTLAAGATAQRDLRLEPRLGEVVLEVDPPTAALRIDGELVGTGPRTVALPEVEHEIVASLEGYETLRRRVTPREGLKQLVTLNLKTEAEARKARLPAELTTALGQTLRLFDPKLAPRNEFTLGASRRDPGRRANEVLHPVRLERPFYLQTTEVTNAQFRLFQASHNSGQVQGNSLNREQQPAVQVSWQQAAAFCNWLSRKEDLPPFYTEEQGIITGFRPGAIGYRLPTEAEWAWVSRVNGEALQRFAWGDEFPPTSPVENVADNTSAYVTGRVLGGYEDGFVVSAPVASFPPNHHGLYDLGGNAAEWVNDVYVIPPANSIVKTDPLGSPNGDNYTIRGASWALSKLTELRLTYRDYGQRGRDDVGFRIARYAE
ncbi:PEGA domain-containing protein [Pseudohaliea rubra]|uniref:Serine/threonine kinase n=1 Tax=Pseudohaliea rubra DSM 19751 TaxID=1265313 RepID=A0A095VSX0_9GAMM|nr:PEGA domain-containing protein [Pseudohaliea rubra]KGE04460.1 serine/threonine kinase [Pseudohaliea rubra DSM 19751]